MSAPSKSFSYIYRVVDVGGNYQVLTGIDLTDVFAFQPSANDIVADLSDKPGDDPAIFGDVPNDQLNGSISGITTENATYLGLASNAISGSSRNPRSRQ